ncbi:MAG: glycosyltransferase family 2 protein [Thermoanaerobaculia bacterium]
MGDPISVLLPAFNEEQAVAQTVHRITEVMQANDLEGEIVVIDDGSHDKTAELAEAAGAQVHRHPHNIGYGRALKRGISIASHDTLVICDADGTYPVEEIPALLAKYDDGFDMIIGARTGFRDGWFKAPLRRFLRWLVEYTCGRRIEDVNSGLRVFDRRTVTSYLPTLCDTFSFTTSLTLAYNMTGRFVGDVPIDYRRRKGRTKVRLVRDSLRTLQYIVQAIIYYNPLKLFLLFSGMCVFLAGVGFLGSATLDLRSGFPLGIGGLLIALIVFCFGLLADLLRQILSK